MSIPPLPPWIEASKSSFSPPPLPPWIKASKSSFSPPPLPPWIKASESEFEDEEITLSDSAIIAEPIINIMFEVENGLSGMRRDIILQLCKLLWYKDEVIRMIIGMCAEHFEWKRRSFFQKSRPEGDKKMWSFLRRKPVNITFALRPNARGGYTVYATARGPRCSYTTPDCRTVFVNRAAAEGIIHWMVQIAYDKTYSVGETASFKCSRDTDGWLTTDLYGVDTKYIFPREETRVPDGSLVSIEADCVARTLAFFVDGVKVPRVVSGVRVPLHFGVSGQTSNTECSFASVSLRRLPAATPSAVACVVHRIKA